MFLGYPVHILYVMMAKGFEIVEGFFLSLLNKLEKFLFLFLHLLSKTCERLQCIATEFLFLWSNLIHVKSCNALRGCFETLEEKQQFSRIWKKHSEWRDVKPGPNSNLLFSGTFNYWWLAVFMFTSQVECSLWSFCLCPAPLPVIYFHCKWLPRLVINHDQGINVDLWKLAITPLDILLKTRGNLANNHDDCAYWNLNDKKILTSPGYAWVMNSVSFAVTYIAYKLSMKQYAFICCQHHLEMIVNDGPALVFARKGGFKLISAHFFSFLQNCKNIILALIPALRICLSLASVPKIRVRIQECVTR